MREEIAIVELDTAPHAAAIQAALTALREAQAHEDRASERLETARQATARARIDLGRALAAARELFPSRGRRAKEWGAFLGQQRIDQDVALDAMKYAGFVEDRFPGTFDDVPGNHSDLPLNLPSLQEAGIDRRPRKGKLEGDIEIDRDTWCTPAWITDAVGEFDLDPCSNERSTVRAAHAYRLDRGEDGLVLLTSKWMDPTSPRVFINPPFSNVMPWVQAYGSTRFCFLLKLDPSTRWFGELYDRTELILIPRGIRVQFDPPPGVPPEKAEAQQFPHALFYARAEDATPQIRERCLAWRVEHESVTAV